MTAGRILARLAELGIGVELEHPDRIILGLPKGLDPDTERRILATVRENKPAILEALGGAQEPEEDPAAWAQRMCARCVSLAICGSQATCCWPLDASRVNRKDRRLAPYLRPLQGGMPCPAEGKGWDRWKQ